MNLPTPVAIADYITSTWRESPIWVQIANLVISLMVGSAMTSFLIRSVGGSNPPNLAVLLSIIAGELAFCVVFLICSTAWLDDDQIDHAPE